MKFKAKDDWNIWREALGNSMNCTEKVSVILMKVNGKSHGNRRKHFLCNEFYRRCGKWFINFIFCWKLISYAHEISIGGAILIWYFNFSYGQLELETNFAITFAGSFLMFISAARVFKYVFFWNFNLEMKLKKILMQLSMHTKQKAIFA